MYHNFFDQKGVNKMAQRKFKIDGGFSTDDASELLAELTMGGSIIPNVDSDGTTGYDLGSTTAKWKDLYLSQGSLYINNQKVLQDDSGTIIVSADEDQGMTVKTTGTGVLAFQSATTVNVNGTLQMASGNNITDSAGDAVAFGDKIDMNNNIIKNVGTAVANTDAANKAYVDGKIDDLVNGAPGALDTLNELANALGDDANYAASVTSAIATAEQNAKDYADANDANTTYSAGNGLTLSGTEFSMSGSYSGSFTATGDITAYSDDSLKTNVQVIDGALGKVEAIRGVTFERIEDGSVSTGVIAQELKEVLPEAVHTDANGVHSVAYGNITGLLIEAVKELSAQVEALKK